MKNLTSARNMAALLAVALGLAACSSAGSGIDSAVSSASTAGMPPESPRRRAARWSGPPPVSAPALGSMPASNMPSAVFIATHKMRSRWRRRRLRVGQSARWNIDGWLPLTDRHGTVEVARSFGKAIPCKDVVFTVDDDDDFYVTTICANKKESGAGLWPSPPSIAGERSSNALSDSCRRRGSSPGRRNDTTSHSR